MFWFSWIFPTLVREGAFQPLSKTNEQASCFHHKFNLGCFNQPDQTCCHLNLGTINVRKNFPDFLPNPFVTLLLNLADHSCWVKVSGIIVVPQGITIQADAELSFGANAYDVQSEQLFALTCKRRVRCSLLRKAYKIPRSRWFAQRIFRFGGVWCTDLSLNQSPASCFCGSAL